MTDRCEATVEVIRGEPRVVEENHTRQQVIEIPETEIHKIVKPGRHIVDHSIRQIPGTLQKDVVDYESGKLGQQEIFQTRYVDKVVVKEVEQIIEVPRKVEEVIYVDEPEYEIVEVPEYYPVVVSQVVQPRVDESKVKVVEDICWIPHVMYDATKDTQQRTSTRKSAPPFADKWKGSSAASPSDPASDVKYSKDRGLSSQIKQTITQLGYDSGGRRYSWAEK